jgi:hypothetical protein
MASRLERPRFFEGQYIGSADLEAVIAYARDTAREHALGAHSWGIATGLELVESVSEGGGVDYFVLPGLGWDGYGRPILLLEPKQVPAAKFAGRASGDQTIWLRYNEAPFQALRPGFETCSAEQSYSRIRESVEVEVGSFGLSEREGGIEVAGISVEDARLAPRLFQDAAADSPENSAPMLCDGAVPHQAFPADSERWLVPIGVATWQNGVPGLLQPRSDQSLKLSRTQRRMAGAVAESLFAADGIIRLRDRHKQYQAGVSLDSLCDPVKPEDLVQATDATDSSKTLPRLVGKELVWVEGNLRVTGHARLFGTRLELLDSSGAEAGAAPLYARRAISANNSDQGQDFQIVIGELSDGKNRLAVGPATNYGPIEERFIVRSNGVFAFGDSIPSNLQANSGTVAATAGATLALAGNADQTSRLSFQSLPTLGELAHVGFDDKLSRLRIGVGADLSRFTYWTDSGRVGIGTDAPICALHIAQAVPTVRIEATGGGDARLELAGASDTSLTHESGSGEATLRNRGVNTMCWYQDRVGVNLSGNIPTTHLHVQGLRAGTAGTMSNHVALIENLGGADADVLALRVAGAQSSSNNNFITFFDSNGAVGRIEMSSTAAQDNPKDAGSFLRLLSGGADFAECLPRPAGAEPIGAGRIVGVRRGEVSLQTDEADSLMITTDQAVVVGNASGGVESGETIALIGQVWALVDGPVESGDFILPSGRNDGAGRAVARDRLLPAEAPQVVGRAWSDSPDAASARVKVAVGMQGADALSALSRALANQQRTIAALEEAVATGLRGVR